MRKFTFFGRLAQFRNEIATLWQAFFDADTPLLLKAAMLGVVAYLISPFDLIPEFLPILGLVDDVVLIPLMVSWIVSRLPQRARARSDDRGRGRTIDGTARRL